MLLKYSGVFRISTRRRRRRGGRVWWRGLSPSPEKNHFFVPKLITLKQFLTGISLGTRILRFSRETKLTKTVQKLSKNSWSDQGGGRTIAPPPEYATVEIAYYVSARVTVWSVLSVVAVGVHERPCCTTPQSFWVYVAERRNINDAVNTKRKYWVGIDG